MSTARPDLEKLLGSLPDLLTASPLADETVGNALRGALSALAHVDFVVVFAYRGQERPLDLYSHFDPGGYEVFVSRYQAGPYLLDPFFHAAQEGKAGVFRMRDLAPDRFFSSEYFRTYYSETELAEEIGFFVPMPDDVTVVASLMRRRATRAFPAREFALIQQAESLVAALVRRFWSGLARRFDQAGTNRRRRSARPHAEGLWNRLDLTQREAAIVELVLQGHSSEAVGERLGIATGTVKVHRRNVYRKLGISSQTQLLSLYLKGR